MFIWIQVLRGLAAAMVVCHHYVASQAEKMAGVSPWLVEFGGSGVDIFFVISGFIMMITQSDSAKDFSAKRFLVRRLIRIAPLYWALTALAFIVAYFASASVNTHISFHKFFMSMWFLPYSESHLLMNLDASKAYVIPMAWTLTFEWFFYLIFALSLALGLRSFARLQFMAFCFACCVVAGLVYQPSALLLQVATSPLVFEFLLGCLVAEIYMRGIRLNGIQAFILALMSIAVLVNMVHHSVTTRIMFWGFAAFVLVMAAALFEGKKMDMVAFRPFARLGDISYSLYLSHFFTLALFVRMQADLNPLQNGFGVPAILVFILINLTVAELCYRFIEEPAKGFFAKRRVESVRSKQSPP